METKFISKENDKVTFEMNFTSEEFENAQIAAYKANKGKFSIPGFRKGKAPRGIIEKQYGEGVFFDDAINDLFSDNYTAAINELNLEVIDRPNATFGEIEKGKDLLITITVSTFPIIEVKDYKGVKIEKVSADINKEDVANEIAGMQKRNARIASVERAAKEGDTVLLDYSGFVGDDQFDGGTATEQELKLGSNTFIPGFEEQLIGVSAGESKDVMVTFPEEYHSDDLAGKEAIFKCKVHDVKEEQLPELDDEFAKDVSEYETMDELKASIEEKLEKRAKQEADTAMRDKIVEEISLKNEYTPPTVMVDDEIYSLIRDMDTQLRHQGLQLEQYLKFMNKDINDFVEEQREGAAAKVKAKVLLVSIADKEKIEINDEDLNLELSTIADAYKNTVEEVKEMFGEEGLKLFMKDIRVKKTIDFLFDNAKIK